YDFARVIVREAGLHVDVEPITTEQFGAPAPRPRYSALDTSLLRSLGGQPASVFAALAEYLAAGA
ncbi:MAG: sugar nucleotide-binding protein, partial [Pirellulaceae bacterium]